MLNVDCMDSEEVDYNLELVNETLDLYERIRELNSELDIEDEWDASSLRELLEERQAQLDKKEMDALIREYNSDRI